MCKLLKITNFHCSRAPQNGPKGNPSVFGSYGSCPFRLLLATAYSALINISYVLLVSPISLAGSLKVSRPSASMVIANCPKIPLYLLKALLRPIPISVSSQPTIA